MSAGESLKGEQGVMQMKKMLGFLAVGVLLSGTFGMSHAAAAGNIWMDESADIQAKQFRKVILLPMRVGSEAVGRVEANQGYNNYLHARINKKIKNTNFLGFGNQLEEKKQILRETPEYQALLGNFNSEEGRAKAIYDATMADGYLVPHLRHQEVRVDRSPATWTTVRMEAYHDIINGPKGNKYKVNYHTWLQNHQIPAYDNYLQMMDMDFVLYDASTGKKAMTLVDYYKNYGVDAWHAYKQITKNFVGDWGRLKRHAAQKVANNAPTISIGKIAIPEAIKDDELTAKTLEYAIQDELEDGLKKVKLDNSGTKTRYYITGKITRCNSGQTWHPPYATTQTMFDHSEKFQWEDSNGNKQTATKNYYRTVITDHFGRYSFWYEVGVALRVIDSQTGSIVCSVFRTETDDDRYANALRKSIRRLCKVVDNKIGER